MCHAPPIHEPCSSWLISCLSICGSPLSGLKSHLSPHGARVSRGRRSVPHTIQTGLCPCGITLDGSHSHLSLQCFQAILYSMGSLLFALGLAQHFVALLPLLDQLIHLCSRPISVLHYFVACIQNLNAQQPMSSAFHVPLCCSSAGPAAQPALPVADRGACWKCPLR